MIKLNAGDFYEGRSGRERIVALLFLTTDISQSDEPEDRGNYIESKNNTWFRN